MDAGMILTTVLGILSQPFVKKAAETALETAAEAAGKSGGEGVIHTLQKFLKGREREHMLTDVAKTPENEDYQAELELQIRILLKNPDFVREITASINQLSTKAQSEQVIRGNNIRNTKQAMTGQGGSQVVDARNDVEDSTQEMTISKPLKI